MTTLLFGMQYLHFYSGAIWEKGTHEASMVERMNVDLWTSFLKSLFKWSSATTLPHVSSYVTYVHFCSFVFPCS
jgi:hypothetical protein